MNGDVVWLTKRTARLRGWIKLFFSLPFVAATMLPAITIGQVNEYLNIGLVADCQYCSDPGSGVRKYALSEQKMRECVRHFNTLPLDYVIHLGDFIDRDYESFAIIKPVYDSLKMPGYHVLGNHDFSVPDQRKPEIPSLMGMPSRYYDFTIKGWRFLVLDGNDISFHAYAAGSAGYREAETYYQSNNLTAPKWNGALGEDQMEWLRTRLHDAAMQGQPVILYCHFPIYPDNIHNLWNAPAVLDLINRFPGTVAWINGHNHEGNYGLKDGVHYLTLKGMVDTEETAYAVMKIFDDRIEITGFGREEDRILLYKKQ
jgi:manganese-dependent ADP-ribose/CDP-alcohol diphosphatase